MVFTNDLNVSVMVGVYIYSLCLWTEDVYYLKFYKLSVNTSSSKCNYFCFYIGVFEHCDANISHFVPNTVCYGFTLVAQFNSCSGFTVDIHLCLFMLCRSASMCQEALL